MSSQSSSSESANSDYTMDPDQPNLNGSVEDEEELESELGQAEEVTEDDDEDLKNEDWTICSIWNDNMVDFPHLLQGEKMHITAETFMDQVTPEVFQLFPNLASLLDKELMVLMMTGAVSHDGKETLELGAMEISFRKPGTIKAEGKLHPNFKLRVHGKLAQVLYLAIQYRDVLVLDSEILHDVGDDVKELDLEDYEDSAKILRLVAVKDHRLDTFNLGEKIQPIIKTNDDFHLPKIPYEFEYALNFQGESGRFDATKTLPRKYYQLHAKKYGRTNGIFPVLANSTRLEKVADTMASYGIRQERERNLAKGPQKALKEFAGKPWTFWLKNFILAIATLYTILVLLCI